MDASFAISFLAHFSRRELWIQACRIQWFGIWQERNLRYTLVWCRLSYRRRGISRQQQKVAKKTSRKTLCSDLQAKFWGSIFYDLRMEATLWATPPPTFYPIAFSMYIFACREMGTRTRKENSINASRQTFMWQRALTSQIWINGISNALTGGGTADEKSWNQAEVERKKRNSNYMPLGIDALLVKSKNWWGRVRRNAKYAGGCRWAGILFLGKKALVALAKLWGLRTQILKYLLMCFRQWNKRDGCVSAILYGFITVHLS